MVNSYNGGGANHAVVITLIRPRMSLHPDFSFLWCAAVFASQYCRLKTFREREKAIDRRVNIRAVHGASRWYEFCDPAPTVKSKFHKKWSCFPRSVQSMQTHMITVWRKILSCIFKIENSILYCICKILLKLAYLVIFKIHFQTIFNNYLQDTSCATLCKKLTTFAGHLYYGKHFLAFSGSPSQAIRGRLVSLKLNANATIGFIRSAE